MKEVPVVDIKITDLKKLYNLSLTLFPTADKRSAFAHKKAT